MRPIYSVQGIRKRFGAIEALKGIDFDVIEGKITGLIGANGAGKSTLLKIIAGAMRPDEGSLVLNGESLRLTSSRDAVARGVALVSQELSLFPALSVFENFWLSIRNVPTAALMDLGNEVLRDLGLKMSLTTPVGSLSLGDRQLVEIARALLQRPKVLVLDEPTSALRKDEVERLHKIIVNLRDAGVGIVYVSHFLEELLELCDNVVVLRDGATVPTQFEPMPSSLPLVVKAMLGEAKGPASLAGFGHFGQGNAENRARQNERHTTLPLLMKDVRGPVSLSIKSIEVMPGQIVGVTGLAGAGVEELFAMLFGRVPAIAGTINLPSGAVGVRSIAHAVTSGVAYIPADRKRLGLMLDRSITDNTVSVRSLVMKRDGFMLSRRKLRTAAKRRCSEVGVKMRSVTLPVGTLSGGNQQKVVFAKWLEANPSLILLDDPTRGVDIGAKKEMYRIIRRVADQGKVVLMYSSDPGEIVALCDSAFVFVKGEITKQLAKTQLTEHGLVEAMNAITIPKPTAEMAR